jgi:WD40 repeat protein
MAIEKGYRIISICKLLVPLASIAINSINNIAISQSTILNKHDGLQAGSNNSSSVYDNIKWVNWGVGETYGNGFAFQRPEGVLSGTFLDDKKTVVIGEDHRIVVWNYRSGSILKVLGLSKEGTMATYCLSGGNILATATGSKISIWNAITFKLLEEIDEQGIAYQIGFSGDGKYLFTVTDPGTSGHTLRIWDRTKKSAIKDFGKSFYTIFSANFSPDGSSILIAGQPHNDPSNRSDIAISLCRYDIVTGNTASLYLNEVRTPLCTCISGDGKYFAAGFSYEEDNWGQVYNDTTLKVWDVSSGKCIMEVTDYSTSVTHLSFLPSGNRVVSTTDSGSICVHSINSNERKILQQSDVKKLGSIAISPDGKVLLSGAIDTKASIWDLDNGVVMRVLDPKHRVGHRAQVWATAYSKDCKMVASGDNTASNSDGLKLWQASNGKLLQTFKSGTVSNISFSPDGSMLASCWPGSEDVKVFNTHSGKLILKLANHKDGATGCKFSSDGRYLLTAAEYADTRLWDVATGKCIQTYSDTVRPREGLSFSGAYTIAISRNDSMIMGAHAGSIDIWDTRSGLLIRKLTDSVNGRSSMFEVRKILSSNDSKTIFTISLDLKGICCFG